MVQKEQLGNNCSERYYLLSEIEQLSQMTAMDDLEEANRSLLRSSGEENTLCMIYLLWRFEQHSTQQILDGFRRMTSSKYFNASNFVLALEVLIPNENCLEPLMAAFSEVEIEIKQLFPNCYVIAGVANKTGATVALEQVLEGVQRASESIRCTLGEAVVQKVVKVVAPYEQNFLGHEPLREPDACGDVVQLLLYDSKESYAKWLDDASARLNSHPIVRHNHNEQKKDKARRQQGDHFLFVQLIGVVLAIASAFFIIYWRG